MVEQILPRDLLKYLGPVPLVTVRPAATLLEQPPLLDHCPCHPMLPDARQRPAALVKVRVRVRVGVRVRVR
eukprot:scaffold36197_cov48-Phaeocystis_antarctica.AAC.1